MVAAAEAGCNADSGKAWPAEPHARITSKICVPALTRNKAPQPIHQSFSLTRRANCGIMLNSADDDDGVGWPGRRWWGGRRERHHPKSACIGMQSQDRPRMEFGAKRSCMGRCSETLTAEVEVRYIGTRKRRGVTHTYSYILTYE